MPFIALCAAAALYVLFAQSSVEIVVRRLDVRVHEDARILRLAGAPRLEERRVFARRAFGAPLRTQVRLNIPLREHVQTAQDFRRHRLYPGHDESQVEGAIELTGGTELPGQI